MSPSSPLRVAVAGLGFMGRTHLRAWYEVNGAHVAAVVSSDAKKLAGDLSETGGNLKPTDSHFDFSQLSRYANLAEALADPAIDVVDLCLPTHLHFDAVLASLRAGKHVLVEKPLARTSAEAYALVEEAAKCGRMLMAGHVLRFFPEWQELARILSVARVKLGSFRRNCASPSWSPWLSDPAKSGGAPLDLLIHDADFVLKNFGEPTAISAEGFYDPSLAIDWISARCSFRECGPVEISGGWHPSPDFPFSMEFNIVTENGTVEWSSAGRPLISYPKTGPPFEIPFTAADAWVSQLQYFTSCVQTGSQPALCAPAESAKAVRLVEIMLESRKRNGELITWSN